MSVRQRDVTADIAVISLLIFIISLLIWVHYALPVLTVGTLSDTKSRVLTVGVTVGATIITPLVNSQIQSGLIRGLENRLRKVGTERYIIQGPANETEDDSWRMGIKSAEQDWRAILNISDANFGYYSGALDRPCFGLCEAPCNASFRSAYTWRLGNNSVFYAANDGASCPPTFMMRMAQGINTGNITDNVYSQAGVAVERNAIGAPYTLFSGAAFRNISCEYGHALISTTQCVPVMTKNPVRCQTGGNVTVTLPNTITLTTDSITAFGEVWPAGAVSACGMGRDMSVDSGMANDMWTAPWYGAEHIGKALLGFSAVNDPAGQVPFAYSLAGAMNDPEEPKYRAGSSTYAVMCVVNPRNAFEYRSVTLDLRALGKVKGSNLAQYISVSQPCTPANPTIGDKLFAAAGVASYQLTKEHVGLDGYISTLIALAGFHRGPPYAFPESTNAFEDVLGLVSGLSVSMMSVSDGNVSASALEGQGGNSTALIEVTRLGLDSSESLWLLIPPVSSLMVLITLSFMSFRRSWAPGGRDFHGTAEQRPDRYVAESLCQIISLGVSAAKKYPKMARDSA